MTSPSRMTDPSRYWTNFTINPRFSIHNSGEREYTSETKEEARSFLSQTLPHFFDDSNCISELYSYQNKSIQGLLWEIAIDGSKERDESVLALLCLRCYISYLILNTGKNLCEKYQQLIFWEVLGYILQDDGRNRYILERNPDTNEIEIQYLDRVRREWRTLNAQGAPLALRVLKKYDPQYTRRLALKLLHEKMPIIIWLLFQQLNSMAIILFLKLIESLENLPQSNLDSLTIMMTRQDNALNKDMIDKGINLSTIWASLNSEIPKHMDWLLEEGDRLIVKAYHEVYRRDRRLQGKRSRCLPPNRDQLDEMLDLLEEQKIIIQALQHCRINSLKLQKFLLFLYFFWFLTAYNVSYFNCPTIAKMLDLLERQEMMIGNKYRENKLRCLPNNHIPIIWLLLQEKYPMAGILFLLRLLKREILMENLERTGNIIRNPPPPPIQDPDPSGGNDDDQYETLIDDFHEQIINVLEQILSEQIDAKIKEIENRPHHNKFAPIYVQMLALFYFCNMTNEQISKSINNSSTIQLEISPYQVQRVLKLKEFIKQIQEQTDNQSFRLIFQRLQSNSELDLSLDVERVGEVLNAIRNYTETKIFTPAQEKKQSGRNIQRDTGIFGEAMVAELRRRLGGEFVCF